MQKEEPYEELGGKKALKRGYTYEETGIRGAPGRTIIERSHPRMTKEGRWCSAHAHTVMHARKHTLTDAHTHIRTHSHTH